MNNEEIKNDDVSLGSPLLHVEDQKAQANVQRRKFAKSGLAVSGVLLTLASRPVLGDVVCKSPSGFLSGNASTHGTPPICSGRLPSYWENYQGWPISPDTLFRNVFTVSPSTAYYPVTLMTLISQQNFDQYNLGMHLVAAYLNAVSGFTPFLPVETIKAMFTEWQSKGFFSPTAQVRWTADQIVDYLKKTQS